MIRMIFIFLILMFGCGKKGSLNLDEKEIEKERIINQERVYKFYFFISNFCIKIRGKNIYLGTNREFATNESS